MNKLVSRSAAALLAVAVSTTSLSALAQGRHDEKPHGMKKIEPRELTEPAFHPGGRHDEVAHKIALRHQKEMKARKAQKDAVATPAEPPGR